MASLKGRTTYSRSMGSLLQLVGIIVLAASVGAVVGALVAMNWVTACSPSEPIPKTIDHLEAISTLFGAEWPYVGYPEGWYDSLYNAQTPLESEWFRLSDRVHIDGIDLVRTKVEDWRERYADWVEDAGERLTQLQPSDPHYEAVEAVHARGQRIVRHVESILDR